MPQWAIRKIIGVLKLVFQHVRFQQKYFLGICAVMGSAVTDTKPHNLIWFNKPNFDPKTIPM